MMNEVAAGSFSSHDVTGAEIQARQKYSDQKISELRERFSTTSSANRLKSISIYAVGSFGRGDASRFSDIDLFFIEDGGRPLKRSTQNIDKIELMADTIKIMREMDFPSPSNDGEYLRVHNLPEILSKLGGPEDDYQNFFTARMLLLLESRPLYGDDVFERAIREIIGAYLRDFEDHAENFRPTFLVNDIVRFWKTLCSNYEHRRNQRSENGNEIDEAKKIKQKLKNLKLGYSRLLTCLSAVAYLSQFSNVEEETIYGMTRMRPIERLVAIRRAQSRMNDRVSKILDSYGWFLEFTNKASEEMESIFSDKEIRTCAFQRARNFGDEMFRLLCDICGENNNMRYLVV